jgi:hypothetical protein
MQDGMARRSASRLPYQTKTEWTYAFFAKKPLKNVNQIQTNCEKQYKPWRIMVCLERVMAHRTLENAPCVKYP